MTSQDSNVWRSEPWYHTFELRDGSTTDGFYDLRSIAAKLPIPSSLEGKRCLDTAACEGFWSFELAQRGAEEVVSLDLPDTSQQDWQGMPPPERLREGSDVANRHFELVRHALNIDNVRRVDMNVYDLADADLGRFDYVFVGNILIHLADPARALRAIKSVMRTGSELLSLEANSLVLSALSPQRPLGQLWDWDYQPRWWTPNRSAHRRLVDAAGFEVIGQSGPLFQPFGSGVKRFPDQRPRGVRELMYWALVRQVGVASGWVRARPLFA